MNTKKLLITAFILVVLAQWFVPARMILDQETVLRSGKEYRFRTAPLDPSDPFRGKYITLNFRDDHFPVSKDEVWRSGENIYVLLTGDQEGFATIRSVSKEKPRTGTDFVKAKVRYMSYDRAKTLYIDYPFDRYYMEESKAPRAERLYNESRTDTTRKAYALVRVLGSKAVLEDVLINGVSIKALAEKRN